MDAAGQVSMNLNIHEDINLFMEMDIKINGNGIKASNTISSNRMQHTCMQWMQEEGCWQHRGRAEPEVQSRSTHDETSFGDWDYEVMAWHEDHMKVENETKKELHVLKWKLKE